MKFNQSLVTLGHHQIVKENVLPKIELTDLDDFLKFIEECVGDVIIKSPAHTCEGFDWELQIMVD